MNSWILQGVVICRCGSDEFGLVYCLRASIIDADGEPASVLVEDVCGCSPVHALTLSQGVAQAVVGLVLAELDQDLEARVAAAISGLPGTKLSLLLRRMVGDSIQVGPCLAITCISLLHRC